MFAAPNRKVDEIQKVQNVKKALAESSESNESYDSRDFDELYTDFKAGNTPDKPQKSPEPVNTPKPGKVSSKADSKADSKAKPVKADKIAKPLKSVENAATKSKNDKAKKNKQSSGSDSGSFEHNIGKAVDTIKDTVVKPSPNKKSPKSKGHSKSKSGKQSDSESDSTGSSEISPKKIIDKVVSVAKDVLKPNSDKKHNHRHHHHHHHNSDSSEEIPMCQLGPDGGVIHPEPHHGHGKCDFDYFST